MRANSSRRRAGVGAPSCRAANARLPASRRSSRPVSSSSRSPSRGRGAQLELAQRAVLPRELGDQPALLARHRREAGQVDAEVGRLEAEVERERPARALAAHAERALERRRQARARELRAGVEAGEAVGAAAERVPADVGRPRRAAVRDERGRRARVGEAPRAAAVVAADDRPVDRGVDPGRAEREADAAGHPGLVLVEPRHERGPVGAQRQLPLAVLADPHEREVDRGLDARRARPRDARREPRGGRVRAAADVAADDADGGADRGDDALADARDRDRRHREQRGDDEEDRDVLGRRLAAGAHDDS